MRRKPATLWLANFPCRSAPSIAPQPIVYAGVPSYMTMRRQVGLGGGVAVFVVAGVLCGSAASFDGSPYSGIVERNVFGLHAPGPVVVENPIATPVIPKVTLTGITTILGRKIALITIASSAKPGEPAEFLMLAEGQSSGGFEVREIDAETGHVKVVIYGREMALNFDQNDVILSN